MDDEAKPELEKLEFEKQKLEYEHVCASHDAITNFRGKLLGFLPLASGAGIFLLTGDSATALRDLGPLGVFVGLFGLLVSIGLFVHELYGIQNCLALIRRGKRLEANMGFTGGQFLDMPTGLIDDYLGPKGASIIIYSAVCAAWAFVAAAPTLYSYPYFAPVVGVGVFLVAVALGMWATLSYGPPPGPIGPLL